MKLAWLTLAAASAVLFIGAATAQPASNSGFFVGFSEDLPRAIGVDAVTPARDLDAKAFRFTLQWAPGQTRVADSDIVDYQDAVRDTAGMKVVLAVYSFGSSAPQTDTARGDYCAYVRDALTRLPSVRDVVIWNEPNKSLFWSPQLAGNGSAASPVAYNALLARCYDVLHDAFADVNVIGLALSPTGNDDAGSHSPGAFIRAVGEAYRASDRARPLFDTVGHHAYGFTASERPWRKHIGSKILSQGDWNKLMYNLWLAFDGTPQAIPGSGGVGIWYMEGGSQTAIDAGKEGAYSGTENVAVISDYAGGEPDAPAPLETSAAPDQYTQVRDSIRLAACQPNVEAYFNFLLFDEPRLAGWQSGAFWADRTAKDSLPAFRQAISETNAATVDCDALKGGRPSADFMPPSTPTDLEATPFQRPLRVELTWSASTDDLSSISYRVFRNGAHVATTSATAWTNTNVGAATTHTYTVRALDSAGNLGGAASAVTVTTPPLKTPVADFDGDGDTDFSVWRPEGGIWYPFGGLSQEWGVSDDVPVPGQYDGDPATDVAAWRPSDGTWYVHGGAAQQWGVSTDVPVPGDYDGDRDTEFAVWRPSTGTWYVHGGAIQQWGVSTDVPVPGDYDGDGDTDFAVWRPSSGTWYVHGGASEQWGVSTDVPVPGDYDGDGDTDFAVWRPQGGVWYVLGRTPQQWGAKGDKPLPPLPSITPPVEELLAAGDIADCSSPGDELTAQLLDANPQATVATMGDNAYPNGSPSDFANCYEPTWGRAKARTRPSPGNHEYHTLNASGYFAYFGAAAGDPAKGYYSYDLGAWHVVSLNSERDFGASGAQLAWLKADLAATSARCVLAYWHKPRFTTANYSDDPTFGPFWQALYDANADLVLNGHDHVYERYRPLNAAGAADPARGIREFVVGTGGRNRYTLRPDPRREAQDDDTWGVLKLTLRARGYDWKFLPVDGSTYTDVGSATCH